MNHGHDSLGRTGLLGLLVFGMVALQGCGTGPDWDGEVRQWGAMRKVLGEGKTEGRVRLDAFAGRQGAYGLGALEGLTGEVTILDGEVWVARAVDGRAECGLLKAADTEATLLVLAQVPRWTRHPMTRAVAADQLDATVLEIAVAAGLDVTRPFPFVVEGRFASLDAHVVNGMCPMRAEPTSEHAPARIHLEMAEGKLVGVHAQGQGGVLTHHGTTTHVHVLIPGTRPRMGHVDGVDLAAGATLLLPATDARQ